MNIKTFARLDSMELLDDRMAQSRFTAIASISRVALLLVALVLVTLCCANAFADDLDFKQKIEPILERYCYDCHAYGGDEGGVSFDRDDADATRPHDEEFWLAVLDNVRAGLMPPGDIDDRPSDEEIEQLVDWIKFDVFQASVANPDPGRILPRRLNRVEYQNTIRDLMGYRFRAHLEFPPDDSGGGFDNNSDALTLSMLLIEKYLAAAESIVNQAVPQSADAFSSDDDREQYLRFFPDGPAPAGSDEKVQYAERILRRFASRAFRRPVEQTKVDQLVAVAEEVYSSPENTFEQGVSRAMMAVLASPRFLFRMDVASQAVEGGVAAVDEYSLASRLSYFLWSSMPDEQLMELAGKNQLREQLANQVERMLDDPKVRSGLVENFSGQWLRTRDIDSVEINGKAVLRKGRANGNRRTKYDFDNKIRAAMKRETEEYFAYILKHDRTVLEFIDSDYVIVNERLADQYDLTDVDGDEFRRVDLPDDSYRGGVLTQGSVLAVTSNPTRTSPVKRGVFILENILGTPPPPPPANVAELEEVIEESEGEKPTLSQALAKHREDALCSSCHNRMDPLGLAFENFIPMGNWRDDEEGRPIDPGGQLITGEHFKDVRELKRILATQRRTDFYRCLTKKLMAYAIGRSLDYRDTQSVDAIVDKMEQNGGQMSVLIHSVIESAPFQKMRRPDAIATTADTYTNTPSNR